MAEPGPRGDRREDPGNLSLNLFSVAGVEEGSESVTAAGVPEFSQRFGFNLPDTFSSHGEVLADFFEGVLAPILQPKTHFDDLLFPRTQSLQDLGCLLPQVQIN